MHVYHLDRRCLSGFGRVSLTWSIEPTDRYPVIDSYIRKGIVNGPDRHRSTIHAFLLVPEPKTNVIDEATLVCE